jgi:methionyl aminopeptidase
MDKSEIDSYVEAGQIAKEVKVFAHDLIKSGMKLIDIAEGIDAKILELGGDFAFPVNLSLNEVAAHFTPGVECDIVAEGILKVDIGVAVDGYIADTAISIDLSEDGEFGDMIKLNEKILEKASEAVKVGMEVRDVGDAVQDVMESDGIEKFAVIKSLSGHTLGKNEIHAGMTISNYRNESSRVLSNIAFAVEPFVTSGIGDIYEGEPGGIYIVKRDGQVRDRDARKVLKFIKERFEGRPFCTRWLVREIRNKKLDIGLGKLKFILGTLVKQDVLYEYPMLIEKSRKPVSQVENTFVIAGGKVICTTG